jgi:hypothetical protein
MLSALAPTALLLGACAAVTAAGGCGELDASRSDSGESGRGTVVSVADVATRSPFRRAARI